MDALRYPIGQFTAVQEPTKEQRKQFIKSIAEMPDKLRQAVKRLFRGTPLIRCSN